MNTHSKTGCLAGCYQIFAVLAVSLLFLVSCIPIVVPLPWFPEDPYKASLEDLAAQGPVHRDDIIQNWGQPWAAINDNNLIYITDKPSSKILVGYAVYGGGGDGYVGSMTHRDFVVSFYFDDAGIMKRFDTYKDTGKHDFCFGNDVCFSEQTRNVPMSPKWMDREAKQFLALPDDCTLFLFRQPFGDGASYGEYVDIQIEKRQNTESGFARSFGASVPGGFFRWQLQSGYFYKVTADFAMVESYPFTTHFIHKKRPATSINVSCELGGVLYLGLVIPKNKKLPVELFVSKQEPAQDKIKQLQMLAGRYVPRL